VRERLRRNLPATALQPNPAASRRQVVPIRLPVFRAPLRLFQHDRRHRRELDPNNQSGTRFGHSVRGFSCGVAEEMEMEQSKAEFLEQFGTDYGYPDAPRGIDEMRATDFKRLEGAHSRPLFVRHQTFLCLLPCCCGG
jgi:hypothetical protein